jgi:hypothetical protein
MAVLGATSQSWRAREKKEKLEKIAGLELLVEKGRALELARRAHAVVGDLAELCVPELPEHGLARASGLRIKGLMGSDEEVSTCQVHDAMARQQMVGV